MIYHLSYAYIGAKVLSMFIKTPGLFPPILTRVPPAIPPWLPAQTDNSIVSTYPSPTEFSRGFTEPLPVISCYTPYLSAPPASHAWGTEIVSQPEG